MTIVTGRWGTRLRRGLADASTQLLVAQLLTAAAAFVVNILAARGLGPSGRGELALLLQIAYLSSIGLLLGTDRSVVAVFSGRAVSTVTAAFLRLLRGASATGVAVAVVILLLPVPDLGSWRWRLFLAALFAVVNAFVRAVRAVAIATERTATYLSVTVTTQLLLLSGLVALLAAGHEFDSAVWIGAYLAAAVSSNGIVLVRWWRREPRDVAPDDLRAARREGLVLVPSTLANSGMLRLDRLLLPAMASTAALGIYAAVGTMTELLAWPVVAFVDSRLGRWRRAHEDGRLNPRRTVIAVVGFLLVGGVVGVLVLRLLLVPLLGPDFLPTVDLVPVLVTGAAVFGLARLSGGLLIARRRSGLSSTAEAIGFGVSVVAYVLLIPPYAATGAAWGSLIGYAAGAVASVTFLLLPRRRPDAAVGRGDDV